VLTECKEKDMNHFKLHGPRNWGSPLKIQLDSGAEDDNDSNLSNFINGFMVKDIVLSVG
jgi:hypothetical protein